MVDDFDESLYREKRRDGTIHLIDALARHTSPYLSKSGNYETLEGRLFPVVDITDYRALFADPGNRSHFRQFRLRPALHPERPPSDFSQAKSREEALRVAGPPWRFREAYYDAKAMFPDPDRHDDIGVAIFDYNLGWVVGLIRNYRASLQARHRALYRAKDKLGFRPFLSLAPVIGAVGLVHFSGIGAVIPYAPFALVGASLFWSLGVTVTMLSAANAAVAQCSSFSGGFSGNAKDAAQKRRNAIEHTLSECARLEVAVLHDMEKANQSGWREGDVRRGAIDREFLTDVVRRINLFARTVEAQTHAANRVAEMAYAGLSTEFEYLAHRRKVYPLHHHVLKWFGLKGDPEDYEIVDLTFWRGVRKALVAGTLLGAIAGAGLLINLLAAAQVTMPEWTVMLISAVMPYTIYFLGNRNLETNGLTKPDSHESFADLVARATHPNLGKAEPRYEWERTELTVSDAAQQAMDYERGAIPPRP